MGRKNRPSKQVDFIRGGSLFFAIVSLVLLGKMDTVEAKSNTDTVVYTSTESVLDKSYDELIDSLDQDMFEDYFSTLEMGHSYIIPGLDKTNIRNEKVCSGMIPQGICVAGDYLIISAYDKSHMVTSSELHKSQYKQKSVLYVMDVESRQYLTTITLDTKCHVGALAYNPDDEIIYIADSASGVVQRLSLERIKACVDSGNDAEEEVLGFDLDAIDTKGRTPSFLAYYQEHLYVGQFARMNLKELFSNQMEVFDRNGMLIEQGTITLPYYAQGVAFADWKDETYMLVSTSYGRDKPASLYVYLMESQDDGAVCRKRKVGKIACPNMSEDIDIQGDNLYTCYESASNFYRLSLDDNGESSNVVDRIMVSSFKKTIAKIVTGDAERYTEGITEIPTQYVEHVRVRMDIDDRRRLFLRLS